MEESWGEIQSYLVEVFDWAGVRGIEAEELAIIPGLDEVFALSDIKEAADSGEWDIVVVDCAPTAETIRLLSLPDVLSWYMDRLFPASRRLNRVVSPILSRVTNLPVAGDDVFGSAQRFYDRIDGVRDLLDRLDDHDGPARRQPRADGDRRGPPHLHLPLAVRVPGRRRRSPTACCPTRSGPVVRRRGRPRTREHLGDDRGRLRPAAGPAGRAGRRRGVGVDALRRLRRRPVRRPRPGRRAPRGRAARGSRSGRRATSWRWTCRSRTATTSRWAATATSCWCGSGPTAGPWSCPTRCVAGRSPRRPCATAGCASRSPPMRRRDERRPAAATGGEGG